MVIYIAEVTCRLLQACITQHGVALAILYPCVGTTMTVVATAPGGEKEPDIDDGVVTPN